MVSDEDYPYLSRFRWCVVAHGYIRRCLGGGYIYLANEIMLLQGITPAWPLEIDHIDHNTWNNQRSNLRLVSRITNLRNRRLISCSPPTFYKTT